MAIIIGIIGVALVVVIRRRRRRKGGEFVAAVPYRDVNARRAGFGPARRGKGKWS